MLLLFKALVEQLRHHAVQLVPDRVLQVLHSDDKTTRLRSKWEPAVTGLTEKEQNDLTSYLGAFYP